MFDLRAKQETNGGFSNATGRGFELALTPVVFGGIGWLVDQAVGTRFAFTIGFAVFAMVGLFVRTWIGYDAEMRRQEQLVPSMRDRPCRSSTSPWAPAPSGPSAPVAPAVGTVASSNASPELEAQP